MGFPTQAELERAAKAAARAPILPQAADPAKDVQAAVEGLAEAPRPVAEPFARRLVEELRATHVGGLGRLWLASGTLEEPSDAVEGAPRKVSLRV